LSVFIYLFIYFYEERRGYGGVDTLANTTTATQRRDRRRELEEKYGLRSASAMAANNLYRDNSG